MTGSSLIWVPLPLSASLAPIPLNPIRTQLRKLLYGPDWEPTGVPKQLGVLLLFHLSLCLPIILTLLIFLTVSSPPLRSLVFLNLFLFVVACPLCVTFQTAAGPTVGTAIGTRAWKNATGRTLVTRRANPTFLGMFTPRSTTHVRPTHTHTQAHVRLYERVCVPDS